MEYIGIGIYVLEIWHKCWLDLILPNSCHSKSRTAIWCRIIFRLPHASYRWWSFSCWKQGALKTLHPSSFRQLADAHLLQPRKHCHISVCCPPHPLCSCVTSVWKGSFASLLNAESATTFAPEEWWILLIAEFVPLKCPRVELCQHPGALRKSFWMLLLGENRKRLET